MSLKSIVRLLARTAKFAYVSIALSKEAATALLSAMARNRGLYRRRIAAFTLGGFEMCRFAAIEKGDCLGFRGREWQPLPHEREDGSRGVAFASSKRSFRWAV